MLLLEICMGWSGAYLLHSHLGIDCCNIREVTHFGPPKNLESYVQVIGRDGQPSKASLLFCSQQLQKYITTNAIIQLCNNQDNCCLRFPSVFWRV